MLQEINLNIKNDWPGLSVEVGVARSPAALSEEALQAALSEIEVVAEMIARGDFEYLRQCPSSHCIPAHSVRERYYAQRRRRGGPGVAFIPKDIEAVRKHLKHCGMDVPNAVTQSGWWAVTVQEKTAEATVLRELKAYGATPRALSSKCPGFHWVGVRPIMPGEAMYGKT